MEKKRIPIYLHLPQQILWFDVHELAVVIIFYLMGTIFGGLAWLMIFIGPALIIPVKRRKPRGWFFHLFYSAGWLCLDQYPLPTENVFKE